MVSGGSGRAATTQLFITLKRQRALGQRAADIARLRPKLEKVEGARCHAGGTGTSASGGRPTRTQFEFNAGRSQSGRAQ